jgi:hypothetical protein
VDLIGHSLGGLVSRSYFGNHASKVDKIVTLGTPHQGAVQAYQALAGGVISQTPNWETVALNMLLQLRGLNYRTAADLLRQEVPVLNNLIPTFDFIKRGRKAIPNSTLSFKNDWLKNANNSFNSFSSIYFISGKTGKNTPEWLKVRSRNLLDRLLDLWPDGKPYRSIDGWGDQTVLLRSSFLGNSPQVIFPVSHRQLPSDTAVIQDVLNNLGIQPLSIPTNPSYPINNTLVFLIASPVALKVTTPEGQNLVPDAQGFIVISSPSAGRYIAKLVGIGGGKYHLLVGQLFDQRLWNVYEGNSKKGKEVTYNFQIDPNSPQQNPLVQSDQELLKAAIEEIGILNQEYHNQSLALAKNLVEQAINDVENSNIDEADKAVDEAIDQLFSFRRNHRQTTPLKRSEKIINLLTSARTLILRKSVRSLKRQSLSSYHGARRRQSLSWRIIRLRLRRKKTKSYYMISFLAGKNNIAAAKQNLRSRNYSALFAHSSAAARFFKEIY